MKIFITGGAGFIGSNLTKILLEKDYKVVVYDNFSTGRKELLPKNKNNLIVIKGDVLDYKNLLKSIKGSDFVFHLSANSDVRKGTNNTYLDLKQGILATHNVLEAMKEQKINKIFFPSSMTVYGKVDSLAVPETYGPCLPISLYASAKLATEGMISTYSHMFGMRAWIFRFANVIGPNLTHGVIFDLIHKLLKNNKTLDVLGNGSQNKPYIHMDDVLSAIKFVIDNAKENINIFNVGVDDSISVKEIVKIILNKMILSTKVSYAKTAEGWNGDVTKFKLDTSKLKNLGFTPKYSSFTAVEKTVGELLEEVKYTTHS